MNVFDFSLLSKDESGLFVLEQLENAKTAIVQTQTSLLIFIYIPIFSSTACHKIVVESVHNYNSTKHLIIPIEKFLTCNQTVFVDDYVRRKLRESKDQCLKQIFENQISNCEFEVNNSSGIANSIEGLVITWNFDYLKIYHNCSSYLPQEIVIKGNDIIKFTNCSIRLNNNVFENRFREFKDHLLIPAEIKLENQTPVVVPKLFEIHRQHIKNTEKLNLLKLDSIRQENHVVLILALSFIVFMGCKFTTSVQPHCGAVAQEGSSQGDGGVTAQLANTAPSPRVAEFGD